MACPPGRWATTHERHEPTATSGALASIVHGTKERELVA